MTQTPNQTSIPSKFIDPTTGETNIEALSQSYQELERKLSGMVARPETPEDRFKLCRLLSMPETPEEYDIAVNHNLLSVDPEINARLHGKGFTTEQVQEVYDLAVEKLVPVILELTQDIAADREVERLIAAFGGPEKWREIARQLLAFGKKNLPADVLNNLSSSFEGVMALHRMMKAQEPSLSSSEAKEAGALDENDLQSMMKDPRYWKQRDPAFVAKVSEGFQKMYGA